MKKGIISVIVLCMLFTSFSVSAINFNAEETYNSVVVVYSETGVGSGFSIKNNMIITNAHVVESDKNVDVGLYDGTTIKGTVIKTDAGKDLALIAVNRNIAPLNINTDSVKIGQEVYAIGAPKDMPYTMTKGIVSALDRELGGNKYIQIDASVNSGNSGGPLVDENGNVIGIITLKASDAEGIGFAIGVSDINNFIDGIETEIPRNGDAESADARREPYGRFETENEENLYRQNSLLKIAVLILFVMNVALGILCVALILKNRFHKKKDEYDFEIEIEE